MAEQIKIDIYADSSSIKELKAQLMETRNQLSAMDVGDANFQKVAQRAGELKDQMKDINEQVAIFAGGSKFEQAGTALGQVKDALFSLDFKGASEKASSLNTIIKGITFKEATAGLGDLGKTFLSLGKSLLMNPLFLIPALVTGILTALGFLGPIIDGLKNAFALLGDAVSGFLEYIGVTNKELEKNAEVQKKATEEAEKAKEQIYGESAAFVSLIYQLKNTNANSKERKTLMKDINEQYGTTLKNMEDETAFQQQLNMAVTDYVNMKFAEFKLKKNEEQFAKLLEQKYEAQIKYNKALKNVTDGYTLIDKAQGKYRDNSTGEITTLKALRDIWGEESNKMTEAQIAMTQADLKMQDLGLTAAALREKIFEYNKETKKSTDETKKSTDGKEKEKKAIDDNTDSINKNTKAKKDNYLPFDKVLENYKNYLDQITELEYQNLESTKSVQQQELDAVDKKYKDLKDKAIGNAYELSVIDETINREKAAIDDKYRKEKEDKDKEAAEKEKQNAKALIDAKFQIANDGLNLISNLTELFNNGTEESAKKAFNVNKAVGIAQATIQTYQSAQAAYLSQLSIPSPDAPIRASIAAGIAVAAGIANIAKIAKTQYKSATPSSDNSFSRSGSVTTPLQPSFQLIGQPNTGNVVNANTGNAVQTINVNASVSVDQITDTQKKLVQIKQSKTL